MSAKCRSISTYLCRGNLCCNRAWESWFWQLNYHVKSLVLPANTPVLSLGRQCTWSFAGSCIMSSRLAGCDRLVTCVATVAIDKYRKSSGANYQHPAMDRILERVRILNLIGLLSRTRSHSSKFAWWTLVLSEFVGVNYIVSSNILCWVYHDEIEREGERERKRVYIIEYTIFPVSTMATKYMKC
jgi:hypothetical protein